MSIIVDGYNYIGRSQKLRLNDPKARDTIISLFGQYCRKTRKSLIIVFDGTYSVNLANRKRQYGRVKVIYTSPVSSADDLIKKMIREHPPQQRKGFLIVTSDEDIVQCAKDHRVAWVRSEDFEQTVHRTLAVLPKIDRTNIRLSPEEVQKWLEIFGADDEELTEPTSSKPPRKSRRKQPVSPLPPCTDPKTPQTDVQFTGKEEENKPRVSKQRPTPKASKKRKTPRKVRPPEELDRINVHLSEDDVEAWLKLFQESGEDDAD
jgi:predicted RNA-binding protein with PIN domain